jgi:hypothetical protein
MKIDKTFFSWRLARRKPCHGLSARKSFQNLKLLSIIDKYASFREAEG